MFTPHDHPDRRAKLVASAVAAITLFGTAFVSPALAGSDGSHPKGGPPGQAAAPANDEAPSNEHHADDAQHARAQAPASPQQAAAPKAHDSGKADDHTTADAPAEAEVDAEEAPGNKGTVKVHRLATSNEDRRNEPKVCDFRIVGFGFPDDAELELSIEGHGGPNAGDATWSGSISSGELSAEGDFATADLALSEGMYKLYVENTTAPGGAKQKVFKVDCEADVEDTVVDDETIDEEDTTVDDTTVDETTDDDTTTDDSPQVSDGTDANGGAVLGSTIEGATASPVASDSAVLGATITRTPASTGSAALPRTGGEWALALAVAAGLLGVGALMVRGSKELLGSSS